MVVSQALSGKFPQSYTLPPTPRVPTRDWRHELTKGLYLAIIGGGIMVGRLITYILTGFRDGPFGFLGFIGFVLLAVGLAKIISYHSQRNAPAAVTAAPQSDPDFQPQANLQVNPQMQTQMTPAPPQPVFSSTSGNSYEAPRTSELEPVELPRPSVTEAETQTLPGHSPPSEQQ